MSAPTLAEAVAQYGRDAYLLTIANDSPHTSFVSVDLKRKRHCVRRWEVCRQEHCQ